MLVRHRLDAFDIDSGKLFDVTENRLDFLLKLGRLLNGQFDPREFGDVLDVYLLVGCHMSLDS